MSVAPVCPTLLPPSPCSCSSTGVVCGNLFLLFSLSRPLSLSLVTLHLICSSWFICLSCVSFFMIFWTVRVAKRFIYFVTCDCMRGRRVRRAGHWPWAVSYVRLISSSLISVVCCWLYLLQRYHFDCQPEGGINVANFISRIRCQSVNTIDLQS